MNAPTTLEDRLRRGLRASADALPDVSLARPEPVDAGLPTDPTDPDGRARSLRSLRPWARVNQAGGAGSRWMPLAAAVSLLAVATAAVVALTLPDGAGEVRVGTPPVREATGRVPGRAALVTREGAPSELRTFGPDGTPSGTRDLAPLDSVPFATSDLQGGWVACGLDFQNPPLPSAAMDHLPIAVDVNDEFVNEITPATTTSLVAVTQALLVWYPAGRAPVVLDTPTPITCGPGLIQVIDAEGPTVVYTMVSDRALHALTLATGADRALPVPLDDGTDVDDTDEWIRWAVNGGQFAMTTLDGDVHLYDPRTGERLPAGPVELGDDGPMELAGDGSSVAAALWVPDDDRLVEVVVLDLATGDELFRDTFDIPHDDATISYDGTTLAVGSVVPGRGDPITVIDVASGDRRTLDVEGVPL